MTTPTLTPPRIVRPLRNINLDAIKAIAEDEQLQLPEMIRLMLSYATFKWTSRYTDDLGTDTHSVKLLSDGIEAVKMLADREKLAWDAMASQLIAFAIERWENGWRKENPGQKGIHGVSKRQDTPEVETPVIPQQRFDHDKFDSFRTDSRQPKPKYIAPAN